MDGNSGWVGLFELNRQQQNRVLTTLEAHSDRIRSITFSPDGSFLASGGYDGTIKLRDLESETDVLISAGSKVVSIAFSPDGSLLASGLWDGSIKLWDLTTGGIASTLAGHSGVVETVAFSPDGKLLASGSPDVSIRLWNVETGERIATLIGHSSAIRAVAFSPDGSFLASGSTDRTVKFWNVETAKNSQHPEGLVYDYEEFQPAPGEDGVPPTTDSIVFSPDGLMFASGGQGGARLWNVGVSESFASFEGWNGWTHSVAFSPDGSMLACGSGDSQSGAIELWSIETKERIAILQDHEAAVAAVAFSPDRISFASGSWDRTLKLWDLSEWLSLRPRTLTAISGDLQTTQLNTQLPEPFVVEVRDQYGNSLGGVTVTFTVRDGDGRLSGRYTVEKVITGSDGRAQSSLTLGLVSGPVTVRASVPSLDPVMFSAEAAGGGELPLSPVEYQTEGLPEGAVIRIGKGFLSTESSRAISISPDGQLLAVASSIGAWLYDLRTLREVALLSEHTRLLTSVDFSGDGTTLLTSSRDHTVKIWDLSTKASKATLERHPAPVSLASFSPDGSLVASTSSELWLWNPSTGDATFLKEEESPWGIRSLAFSPDGSILASGDQAIELWKIDSGEIISTLDVSSIVNSLAISPDGRLLSAGLHDGRLQIWDIVTGKSLGNYKHISSWIGWPQAIQSVVFSPDGSLVIYGALDNWVRERDWKTGVVVQSRNLGLEPESMVISSDGRTVGISDRSRISLWDRQTQNVTTIKGHPGWGSSVVFSLDGSVLAMGGSGGVVGWNVDTGSQITYHDSTSASPVVFSSDGRLLAFGGDWNEFHILNIQTGERKVFEGHTNSIGAMAFAPDGGLLAVGDDDSMVRLWDLETDQNTLSFEAQTEWIREVAFSQDSRTVSAELAGEGWELWDAVTGENLGIQDERPDWVFLEFSPNTENFRATAFSPDGKIGATWTHGLWRERHPYGFSLVDPVSGEYITTLRGHAATIWDVAFSPDSSTLATVSEDGTALLWDLRLALPHPRSLVKLSGDEQEAIFNTTLFDSLVVEVRDQNGDLFEGAQVTFAVTTGDGTLSTATATTDAKGRASTTLTLGEELGVHTVEVRVVTGVVQVDPAVFSAIAKANPDFDLDGEIGFSDFFLFAEAFGGSDPRFDLDADGEVDFADFFLFAESFGQADRAKLLALAQERIGLPENPGLQQNWPNPFNSGTVISWFQLQSGSARLEVYSLTGQRVITLASGYFGAGLHRLHWDGRDGQGRLLATGIYLYQLTAGQEVHSRKLTLLR